MFERAGWVCGRAGMSPGRTFPGNKRYTSRDCWLAPSMEHVGIGLGERAY